MGRQAFLTRLALGRSAFEPLIAEAGANTEQVDAAEPPENDASHAKPESAAELLQDDCPIASASNYMQQYDKKGYPQNSASKALKKRWRHAVNDVLATVGVCVAKGQHTEFPTQSTDASRLQVVLLENDVGIFISGADWIVRLGFTCWSKALRQRLQTFCFYSGIPLVEIIKSEWQHFGGLPFLFAGAVSRFSFVLLEAGVGWSTEYAFNALRRAIDTTSDTRGSRVKDALLDFAEMMTKISLSVLITPFEIYGTLQRLGLVPAWPVLPYPQTFLSGLSGILRMPDPPTDLTITKMLSYIGALVLSPLFLVWFIRDDRIRSKIYRYVWAALPKPTRPDCYSLQGARKEEIDTLGVAGLIDEDDPLNSWINMTFTNQLAFDLQSIRWRWQSFCDRWMGIFGRRPPGSPTASSVLLSDENIRADDAPEAVRNSPVTATGPAPEFRERGQIYTEYPLEELREREPDRIPSLEDQISAVDTANLSGNGLTPFLYPQGNTSSRAEREEDRGVNNLQGNEVHNPPNHFSPPLSSPSNPSRPVTPSPPVFSTLTSPLPSLPASPRPIELTSNDRDGVIHVNLTLPAPVRTTSVAPSTAQYTTIAEGAARVRDSRTLAREAFSIPYLGSRSATDPTLLYYRPMLFQGPYHRVTLLSAHPAEGMAQRLSDVIVGLLFLPLEALFVRSVALAFLSSPGSTPGASAAAARWKREVFPLGTWFGPGLSAGGWRGVGDYVGKMVLMQGLETGVGFVTWQIGMGAVWWVGRKWCQWKFHAGSGEEIDTPI